MYCFNWSCQRMVISLGTEPFSYFHRSTTSMKKLHIIHGSHIFELTNFPDFSPDLSSILFPFSSIFSVFYLMNLTNTKIYLTYTLQLKVWEKILKKNKPKISSFFPPVFWVKCSHFSSILGKIPWLSQFVQNSLIFPWLEKVFPFSRFSQTMTE